VDAGFVVADTFVVADADGRVRVDGLPPGRYVAHAAHDALDEIGVVPPPREITIAPGAVATDTLATPSLATLWASCGRIPVSRVSGRRPVHGEGVVYGTVRDARDGRPRAGVVVSVWWGGDEPHDDRVLAAVTDDAGAYAVCAVPLERGRLRLQAAGDGFASDVVTLTIPADRRAAARDLRVDGRMP
jgi:hypothetical protein